MTLTPAGTSVTTASFDSFMAASRAWWSKNCIDRQKLADYLEPHLARTNKKALARTSGVTDRSIRRIMNGHSKYVRIEVAERLLEAVGGSLWEVE